MTPTELEQIIGVRWTPDGPLVWCRAPGVGAAVGDWVVVNVAGTPRLGRVFVGRGQCVGLPERPDTLPLVLRQAHPEEFPPAAPTAGQRLLATIPQHPEPQGR